MLTDTLTAPEAATLQFEKDTYFGFEVPFMRYLGLQPEHIEPGYARARLPLNANLTNSRGDVHGGTMMSVLDFILSAAARSHDPLSYGVVTIDMSTHFLNVARTDLVFEARPLRRGRSIVFCEGSVKDANDVEVCTARAVFKLVALNKD
ncbi:PaaI family thioesterase [Pusillimonas sp. ANT_WB101]|uniref:PaaI family thioesterase n=1 Tax=Pusillimonas sp. ANT_WB101 TaxID=2597356 RepID=UPI0011EDB0ED|nr:PaaI family thioesterase [Pusillimonas sp. ANT_WB101]KAA0889372.1 PaaI family thioesterase [Pusillimonas sp. ANT_WB101]NYT78626.1 PaaI family thioesterase [Alcaligenaceae bacterium]